MKVRALAATVAASVLPPSVAQSHPGAAEDFGPSVEVARSRGPQIFNAVHDSMRQWGSSLHHNGMSFYLATVPEGVLFHHGNHREESPTDPDWLAYEIEHAEGFARGIWGPPGGGPPGKKPPGGGGPPPPPAGEEPPEDERRPVGRLGLASFEDGGRQHAMLGDQYPPPPEMGIMDGEGGWLHVYRTMRPLRYLYVDGMGGGKTSLGTLDSQDYLLIGDRNMGGFGEKPKEKPRDKRAPPGGPAGEGKRATELCKMCQDWDLSGVIRMEAGFEIIHCNFSDGLEQIQALQRPDPNNQDRGAPGRGMFGSFEMIRGLAERYHDIGSTRTIIDYSSMVSAFFYPVNLTNPDPERPHLPRLSNATDAELAAIKSHLTQVIAERHGDSLRMIDWQDVTDMIVGRYADRIKYMAEKVDTLDEIAAELDFLLTVFTDYSGKGDDADQVPAAIDRCTRFYLRGITPVTEADRLIFAALEVVSSEICVKLFDVRELVTHSEANEHEASFAKAVSDLKSLMGFLNWARFKRCPPCGVDAVCLIPMWPFGTKEDYESPRCVNSSDPRGDGESYWGGWGPGRPGGKRPGGPP